MAVSIGDAHLVATGFRQIRLPAEELARLAQSPTQVRGGLASEACRSLFETWRAAQEAPASTW